MIQIDSKLTETGLRKKVERLFSTSGQKIRSLDSNWDTAKGSPVFTVGGKYTSRGWTEWTQGFQFGSAILQYDATGDKAFLEIGRTRTLNVMAPHVTHVGVHDHGFNNVSTYGNLLRLMNEGSIPDNEWERHFYELALKCSGAVQAARWTRIAEGGGFIYSFNGPHSLFVDTIRSLRALAVSHHLGHVLMGENDRRISLLGRTMEHARATARYSVFYGAGRDSYDVRGRTAHESIFNVNDGVFRCPNSQQGYSPFSTWTRGLAWAMLGFAEQLEFFGTLPESEFTDLGGSSDIVLTMKAAAEATCDFYLENTPTDGVAYWDTGAPGLAQLGDWASKPSDPYNDYEPVDSSAAVIAAQGLLRLGRYLGSERYRQAGLTIANTIFDEPYLSTDPSHEGLILHGVYHRPNNWDAIPSGRKVPVDESCMWGDYHAMELGVYLLRTADKKPYLTFWSDSK